MYTDIDDPNLDKTLFRKEYASLRINKKTVSDLKNLKNLKDLKNLKTWNPSSLTSEILAANKLQLQTYQAFPPTWLNPNNVNLRLLLKFDTGTGKTVATLTTALNFIKSSMESYRVWESQDRSPEVFIIGFSRQIFIKELMRRPEFGFITREEIARESRLRSAASAGSALEREELAKFHTEIKKRFTKKNMGGFLRFYGYKEFFNRLFIFTVDGLKKLAQLVGIDTLDRSNLTEDQILLGLKERHIGINLELVDAVTNGFMAFDEFHHAYNAVAINNYGIAIRIVLMIHDRPDIMKAWVTLSPERLKLYSTSAVRAIFMTATPINNSPTEIIDLLNVLVRLGRIQEWYRRASGRGHNQKDKGWATRVRLEKEDFFDGRSLRKGAIDDIAWLVRGTVSYLSDTNPAYFPTYSFEGESIPIPKSLLSQRLPTYNGKIIPYLKFIRCQMSKLHLKTYLSVFKGTLPPDGQSLLDMVLPSPDASGEEIGLFKTRDIKQILKNAPSAWKAKYKIDVVRQNIGSNVQADVIVGEFMRLDELKKYATKYTRMMYDIIKNLKDDGGKIIINHQAVRGSGVLFLEEVLRVNGIIDEFSEPLASTICSKCGHAKSLHNSKSDHAFIPTRFIILHSDIEKQSQERSTEKFKHVSNLDGYLYRIVLGSQIINESIDLSEVREIKIMTVPDDISTLIQIIGRAIRKYSHNRLPPHKRHVNIQIYTSSLGGDSAINDLSYEERRYLEKSMDYLVIQEIDRVLNSEAIDSPFNYDIINPLKTSKSTSKTTKEKANDVGLGHLPYEISDSFGAWKNIINKKLDLTPKQITTATWEIFFGSDEVGTIIYAIKRLFIEQSRCWTYDDLWVAVQDPPFELNINTHLFSEESFVLALDALVDENSITTGIDFTKTGVNAIDSLFNPLDKTIRFGDTDSRVVYIRGYYILLPIQVDVADTSNNEIYGLGKNVLGTLGTPDIDIESWSRTAGQTRGIDLNITHQLQTASASYEQLKMRFHKAYNKSPIQDFPSSLEVYGVDFHVQLVQDAIRYCFNILINPDMRFSELHVFYFKLLYFYDKFDLILYAADLEGTPLFSGYEKYTTKTNIKYGLHAPLANGQRSAKNKKGKPGQKEQKEPKPGQKPKEPKTKHKPEQKEQKGKKQKGKPGQKGKNDRKHLAEDQYNAFLLSSMNKTAGLSKPFNLDRLDAFLGRHKSTGTLSSKPFVMNRIVDDINWIPKPVNITRVFGNMLPVGHFMSSLINSGIQADDKVSVPTLYNPDFYTTKPKKTKKTTGVPSFPAHQEGDEAVKEWYTVPRFAEMFVDGEVVENDMIIGYYDQNPSSIELRFKLRAPIHKMIRHDDTRMMERGSVCSTRKKDELLAIAKQLDIKPDEDSIRSLCDTIKLELMRREIMERRRARHAISKNGNKKSYRIRWFYFHFEKQPHDIV